MAVINKAEFELTGTRKAAVLLMALDPDTGAKLLRAMKREHVEEVTRHIAKLDSVPSEVRNKVISEFYNLLLARQYMNVGGLPAARALLMRTLSPEEAKRVIQMLEHQVTSQPFSFLQKTETENLLTFLTSEHPQTIALVLSHLPPAMASEVLVALEPGRQVEVVQRIASMDQTSPEVIKEVESGLEHRLAGIVAQQFERTGGVRAVAEILNLSGRAAERTIMDGLGDTNPELVDEIRRLMFVFEDIVRIDDRGIQSVLKEVENDELALALKTASEELRNKIFGNMSERAADMIREEMEFMGPVRVSDVEAAQQKIVDVARRLEEAGDIIISGKGGGENDMIV